MRRLTAIIVAAVLMLWAPLALATDLAALPNTIHHVWGPFALQSAATTGNGSALPVGHQLRSMAVYVTWSTGCTAGVVDIQVAQTTAGPWKTVATLTYGSATMDWVAIAVPVGAVRASITTTVVNGTLTVTGYGI
jgi:hypothetical protein